MLVGVDVGDKIHVLLLNNLYGINLLRVHKLFSSSPAAGHANRGGAFEGMLQFFATATSAMIEGSLLN
jgi:hypothetical protein